MTENPDNNSTSLIMTQEAKRMLKEAEESGNKGIIEAIKSPKSVLPVKVKS